MSDIITDRATLIREVRKPGKVYVTMLVRNDVHRILVQKSDLIDYLNTQPETDCEVMGFRDEDGFVIDSNV